MPTSQDSLIQDNFTSNQTVDPAFSTDDSSEILKLIRDCVSASDSYRNKFANLSGSWVQDSTKYESLYDGHLYTEREKAGYECKEDVYRDFVDFNTALLTQFDSNEYIRQFGSETNSITAELMTRTMEYAHQLNETDKKDEDTLKIGGQMGIGIQRFKPIFHDGKWWPGSEVIDPRQFGISPGATSIRDAVYCFWRRPVSTVELKQ